MVKESIYYAIITILVIAFIEKIRIQKELGIVGNINHLISVLIAGTFGAVLWIFLYGFFFNWHLITYSLSCLAVRGIFYDPALNLWRREHFDYTSNASNSKNEQSLNRVGFWQRRLIFLAWWLIVFILYIVFHPVL
jgi:hypothetical protein